MARNPDEQPTGEIDHEAVALAVYEDKQRRYAAFDSLIDLALDNADIQVSDQIDAFKRTEGLRGQ